MTPSFEQAFQRLEQILERLNSQEATLEESLVLFEEASSLMATCQQKLTDAERRVELVIKNRQGEISLTAGKPETTPFQ